MNDHMQALLYLLLGNVMIVLFLRRKARGAGAIRSYDDIHRGSMFLCGGGQGRHKYVTRANLFIL